LNGDGKPCFQGPASQAPKNAKATEPNSKPWNQDKVDANPNHYKDRRAFQKNAAYMPIREIGSLLSANYQWTPVYGKSLFFLSQVVYLDFYLNAGLGVTLSNFYPLKETFVDANGNTVNMKDVGVIEDEQYGLQGRPNPIAQTSPTANFAIGSRFFMARKVLLDVQLKNYSIIGSDGRGGTDFSTPFALTGGLGILF
jgi:hypothetical protein